MIEMGIDEQITSVERKFRRKVKTTNTTNKAPTDTIFWTLETDRSMNSEVSLRTETSTPGTWRLTRTSSSRTRRAIAIVFSPDCFVTDICNPGRPLIRTIERRSSVVSRTSAISRT